MSELLQKSKSNFEAANWLISSKHYCSSVHCAYFSCLQKAKHVLLEVHNIKDEDFVTHLSDSKQRQSSHVLIRNKILDLVRQNRKSDFRDFNRDFNMLKKNREDSDYLNVNIDENMATQSYRISQELNKLLDRI